MHFYTSDIKIFFNGRKNCIIYVTSIRNPLFNTSSITHAQNFQRVSIRRRAPYFQNWFSSKSISELTYLGRKKNLSIESAILAIFKRVGKKQAPLPLLILFLLKDHNFFFILGKRACRNLYNIYRKKTCITTYGFMVTKIKPKKRRKIGIRCRWPSGYLQIISWGHYVS